MFLRSLPRAARVSIKRGHSAAPVARCFHAAAAVRARDGASLRPGRLPGAFPSASGDPKPASRTDTLADLNVLSSSPAPSSAVETIFDDGFLLSSGVRVEGAGVLLVQNDAFEWRPAQRGSPVEKTAIEKGTLELGPEAWGLLDVVHPKPEMLIIGTGKRTLLLSKADRSAITEMGIRMDVMDTTHAAAQYDLLATERPGQIAAALMEDAFGNPDAR